MSRYPNLYKPENNKNSPQRAQRTQRKSPLKRGVRLQPGGVFNLIFIPKYLLHNFSHL